MYHGSTLRALTESLGRGVTEITAVLDSYLERHWMLRLDGKFLTLAVPMDHFVPRYVPLSMVEPSLVARYCAHMSGSTRGMHPSMVGFERLGASLDKARAPAAPQSRRAPAPRTGNLRAGLRIGHVGAGFCEQPQWRRPRSLKMGPSRFDSTRAAPAHQALPLEFSTSAIQTGVYKAINYCLRHADITVGRHRRLRGYYTMVDEALHFWPHGKLHWVPHHLAHAEYVLHYSGLEPGLVLVVDAHGTHQCDRAKLDIPEKVAAQEQIFPGEMETVSAYSFDGEDLFSRSIACAEI